MFRLPSWLKIGAGREQPALSRARLSFDILEDRIVPSHGRYWNLSWEPVASDPSGRTIEFHFQFAWLTPFYAGDGTVGAVVNTDTINFGDTFFGASVSTRILSLIGGVAFGEAVRDTDPGPGTVWEEGIVHTYAANGNYNAFVNSCCRVFSQNGGGSYNIPTIVNIGTFGLNRSPIVATAPVVQIADNTVATFPISAVDPDFDPIRFRLSTPAELGGDPQPTGLTINPTTGVVTWDVTPGANPTVAAGQLWFTQIMVEDLTAPAGSVKTKVPVDFILQIVDTTTNAPPVFNSPPTPTVPINLIVGNPVSFNVQATDPNAVDIVTLGVLNPPAGMTITPVGAPGNTTTIQINWTPAGATPVVLILQATDPSGLTSLTSVTITPNAPAPPPPPPPPPDEGSYGSAPAPGMPGGASGPFGSSPPTAIGGEGSFGFGGGRSLVVGAGGHISQTGDEEPLTPQDALIADDAGAESSEETPASSEAPTSGGEEEVTDQDALTAQDAGAESSEETPASSETPTSESEPEAPASSEEDIPGEASAPGEEESSSSEEESEDESNLDDTELDDTEIDSGEESGDGDGEDLTDPELEA